MEGVMSSVLRDFGRMVDRGQVGPRLPLAAPRQGPCDRRRRAVGSVTIIAVLSLAISGCAVGPNFNPAAAPDVTGYVPGKLASPDPGRGGPRVASQHFVTRADLSAPWWSAFRSPLLTDLLNQPLAH